ncbi:MAG: hypothetical protein J7L38_04955 [Thermoproteales archaeon]|nr:hypothetical protein [Thermoproteales archaeon]
MSFSLNINFRELVQGLKWMNIHEFADVEEDTLLRDVKSFSKYRNRLRKRLEEVEGFRERIKRIDRRFLEEAFLNLKEGEAYGIDGTLNVYPTPFGTKCRIGVVAVNYAGERLEETVYVSDTMFIDEEFTDNIVEFLKNVEKVYRFSELFYRSLMLYKEREVALKYGGKYRLVQGPLMPLELRIGRMGIEGFLEESLLLGARLIEDGKVAGVLSTSRHLRLISVGMLLKPGEYMYLTDLRRLIKSEVRRLLPEEEKLVEDFAEKHASKIGVGVYKISAKPYLFQAPKERFDEFAHLIMADALNNRMHGFPLLLAYADNICRRMFSPEDFRQRLESIILRCEGDDAAFFFDERRLRPG